MSEPLKAPLKLKAAGKDGGVSLSWEPVSGATGYRVYFYGSDDPEKVIRARYTQGSACGFIGFTNGREYLVEVCGFRRENGREILGERSAKARFVPISIKLKAQRALCMSEGEAAQLFWEEANRVPEATFRSDRPDIAEVDGYGNVTAHKNGTAHVTITSENGQTFVTRVEVGRNCFTREQRAVLMFAGDLMCGTNHQRQSAKHRYEMHDAFRSVRDILSGADFSAGVLETVCCDEAPFEYEQRRLMMGPPNMNSPSTFAAAAASAGFSAMVTANNHNIDWGAAGLRITVEAVRKSGMLNIGTLGCDPVCVDINGIRTAFIACTMISNGMEKLFDSSKFDCENPAGAYSREYFTEMVSRARSMGAEYIAAIMHWGRMNSHSLRSDQKQEAQFIADAGADIIIGSHPHLLQRFSYVTSADGRKVPCAYSLGNFISSMTEIDGNRDGIILRAELRRTPEGITTEVSYIPCMTEIRDWGTEVVPVAKPFSIASRASLKRIQEVVGSRISGWVKRPRVLISGSEILNRVFKSGEGFRVSRAGYLLSQIALGSAPASAGAAEGVKETRLALDLTKDLTEAVRAYGADYVAVDLLTAVIGDCWQETTPENEQPRFFSTTKLFRRSEYFQSGQDRFTRVKPPFPEEVWKPALRNYAEKLLAAVPSERIILFRYRFSSHAAEGDQLRVGSGWGSVNRALRAMENYFIALVNPLIVDLSEYHFTKSGACDLEDSYYLEAYRAAEKLTSGEGRTGIFLPDDEIWFQRVMKYYGSMTSRAYYSWLMDMDNAADQIIAWTSAGFAGRNSARLLKLRRAGKTELASVGDFFEGDKGAEEIVRASEIVHALLNGHTDRSYEFFQPAFREHFGIIRKMARLLSVEIGASVNENSAELAFLLRGKPQMKRYVSSLNRMTLDIWGSCVSREAVNRCRDAYVGTYIFKQSQLLAFEPRVEAPFPDDLEAFCGNRWRRRTLRDSLMRSGDADIKGSDSQWIIVDLYDVICRMVDYKGGLFEIDDFICRTDFYKSIRQDCRECYIFERRDMKFCFENMTRFAKMIQKKYGEHIILIKTDPKDLYVTLDDRLEQLPDDGMFEIKRKFISLCEERFASVTSCYVIDITKHFYASDSFPLGGAHIVHYEDEFYRQAGAYISEILSGSSRRVFSTVDDNYLLLRNLRLSR